MKKVLVIGLSLVFVTKHAVAQDISGMPTQQQAMDDMFECATDENGNLFDEVGMMPLEHIVIPKTKRSFSLQNVPMYIQLACSHLVHDKLEPLYYAFLGYLKNLKK